jgi:hypothetical protein
MTFHPHRLPVRNVSYLQIRSVHLQLLPVFLPEQNDLPNKLKCRKKQLLVILFQMCGLKSSFMLSAVQVFTYSAAKESALASAQEPYSKISSVKTQQMLSILVKYG